MTKIKIFLEMIRFEHTLFALPYAYVGAFLASGGVPRLRDFLFITLAMVGARTAAMSLNRLIDRHIDALNPRTQNRALPRGLIKVSEVYIYTILSLLLFFWAAANLKPLALKLLPLALFVLVIYAYTKRFTWACHLVLGLALSFAPLGSFVGIEGYIPLPAYFLAAGVLFWVAGFDIIYALQDVEFDRQQGLYSIPSRFGIEKALTIARVFHFLTIIFFLLAGIGFGLGFFYYFGVIATAILLLYEHWLVKPTDLSRVNTAFNNVNMIISVLMFGVTVIDLLI
ncbi:UbiA-like polyprenyltransferase [Carboxydothermus hydrogenoformans]|uniref:4-hydroxybenzoate polyprenyltransferase n=1 Tax=Carboxydothermus hydrogenoformans (strain ATCC BAA-161 / DSM 6008 / Z-2901) TaxID=246194 RepID=Q3AB57_CARHZ|nr:UbiA-like polyprenyltransferase [Carboxydothermus hydrogenoformans]ABB13731.1 putative 4-hydroxybenzoate polyprenyltransferase [Carboxydothermus hydrogenoformans Z-2901]